MGYHTRCPYILIAFCQYPMRYRIFHLAISPLMDRISSFPAWDIPCYFLVSFIAILACSAAFQFVIFLCYAILLIIPNLCITRKYSGHTFIYWTHRYGLNNGGSVVLGPTISFVVVTCRHGEGCTSARCTTRRASGSTESYIPVKNISWRYHRKN